MNCLFHAYSATLLSRSSHFVYKSSACGFSTITFKRSEYAALKSVNLDLLLTRFGVRCYATRRAKLSKSVTERVELKTKAVIMKEENNSFFVVRKGDLVGVYKNFSDCQAQVGSSVNNIMRISVKFLPFVLVIVLIDFSLCIYLYFERYELVIVMRRVRYVQTLHFSTSLHFSVISILQV